MVDPDSTGPALRNEATSRSPVQAQPVANVTTDQLDPLLGLALRDKLASDIQNLRATCSERHPVTALLIDVDKFKQVNDVHGHATGDEVLVGVVSVIKPIIAGRGTIYRYGGDEIIVLLPNQTVQEASATAERIRGAVSQVRFVKFPEEVTVSIGAASCPANVAALDDLFAAADRAMYQAKDLGGNAVRVANFANSAPEPGSRIIRTDITSRVEAVELWMSVNQANSRNFMIVIENDSDEEVRVEGIVLRVGTLYLSRPATPRKTDNWIVPAHSKAHVSGEFPSDPTRNLGLKNPTMVAGGLVEIDIVAVCRVLGRLRRLPHTIMASANNQSITQFSF